MGWWIVSADTLAASRFVISPLAETTASLMTLERGTASHPGERAWLDTHRPAYRQRLAADPVAARTVRAALGRNGRLRRARLRAIGRLDRLDALVSIRGRDGRRHLLPQFRRAASRRGDDLSVALP